MYPKKGVAPNENAPAPRAHARFETHAGHAQDGLLEKLEKATPFATEQVTEATSDAKPLIILVLPRCNESCGLLFNTMKA